MTSLNENDGSKWINATVVLVSILLAYLLHAFIQQLGDWFDLEAKIKQFGFVNQGVSALFGVLLFVGVIRSTKAKTFLSEVYGELLKVVWPDKDSTIKLTLIVVVSVSITSGILLAVDIGIQKLLALFY